MVLKFNIVPSTHFALLHSDDECFDTRETMQGRYPDLVLRQYADLRSEVSRTRPPSNGKIISSSSWTQHAIRARMVAVLTVIKDLSRDLRSDH